MSTPSGTSVSSSSRADIGVIGGSGFYQFLEDAERVRVTTPFGDPSDDVVVGEVEGRRVAFLARHGQGHRFPPHRVNYRANLWALRAVGVRQVLAPCAVGSLVPAHGPGTVVVPDQVVDRTWGREHTVYDGPGPVVHAGFADPYCPRGRAAVLDAVERAGSSAVAVRHPRRHQRPALLLPRRVALAPAGRLDGGGDDRHARGLDRARAGDVLHHRRARDRPRRRGRGR